MRINVPLVGPTYTSRSLPVADQVTKGFYIETAGGQISALQPFPGLKLWATAGTGKDRGLGVFNDELYKVTGTTLYKVDKNGTATSIGTIPGVDRCEMVDDGNNLVIAYKTGKPATYDGSTLTIGTDVDLPNASTVTYINRRVVYDGNNRDVAFADLDTPLSVDSSNVTSVDTTSADMVAVTAKDQQLFAFTKNNITPYYNSGRGNPPFDVIQNATKLIGLGAEYSIGLNKNHIYFLGSDLEVYRLIGLQLQPIGNPSIGKAIAQYANPANAIGFCFSIDAQEFYYLSFPQEESWLFSEDAGWTNLSYGADGAPHLMNSYAYIYGKHLVSDRRSGKIYELDFDTYTDGGDTIHKVRTTDFIDGAALGVPGREVFWHRLEIVIETGVGTVATPNPLISMEFSDDGGRSWFSGSQPQEMGDGGEYKARKPIIWTDLGSSYKRQFRFTVTDSVKTVLISANADVSVGSG